MATTRSKSILKGEAELIATLRRLPGAFRPVLDSVPPAAERLRDRAAAAAPSGGTKHGKYSKDFGKLRDSIIVEVRKRNDGFINVRVGPDDNAPHGLWIELGHNVSRSRISTGGRILGSAPPQPFLGPAWKSTKNAIRKDIRTKFKELIDRAGQQFRPPNAA